MSILTLTACILGILFFMAGCLHIGMYVATTSVEPFAIFFSGLMQVSWPLAVAAILFALLDICIRINNPTPRTRTEDEADDIQEAPLRRSDPAAAPKPGSFSYFAVQPDTVPPEAIKQEKPKPKEPSIFATPPPFHKEEPPSPDEEPTGRPAPGSKENDSSSDLSFFKL